MIVESGLWNDLPLWQRLRNVVSTDTLMGSKSQVAFKKHMLDRLSASLPSLGSAVGLSKTQFQSQFQQQLLKESVPSGSMDCWVNVDTLPA